MALAVENLIRTVSEGAGLTTEKARLVLAIAFASLARHGEARATAQVFNAISGSLELATEAPSIRPRGLTALVSGVGASMAVVAEVRAISLHLREAGVSRSRTISSLKIVQSEVLAATGADLVTVAVRTVPGARHFV